MKKRNKPVIPGFGLSMGITISILSLVVLIPLASLVVYTAKLSFKDIIETITQGPECWHPFIPVLYVLLQQQ